MNTIIENFLYLMTTATWIIFEAFLEWYRTFYGKLLLNSESKILEKMGNSISYEEWRELAQKYDIIKGSDAWRSDPTSDDYDYKLISARLRHLKLARDVKDVPNMIYSLRAGLLRNLGGLSEKELFSHSLLGTKHLIEDYTREVVSQLEYLANSELEGLSPQAKVEFFTDTRQSFGNTALLLNGGATFGMFHLGVVKCLHENDLLPRIIAGTSVGALIASLVCAHEDPELPKIFHSNGINLSAFSKVGDRGSIKRKFLRLLKHGHLMDVKVLEDCVKSNVGDITFEEAFLKTKRILNVVVSSQRKNEVPRLLNYLTAPNVLIRSAAIASCAVTGLYDSVPLLAKDNNGAIVPWNTSAITWSDASIDHDGPTLRLAEIFNVNHVIMSQANPYRFPFLENEKNSFPGIFRKLTNLFYLEVRHRLFQLNEIGLLPSWMRGFIDAQLSGSLVISPYISINDYKVIISNPNSSTLNYWVLKGERATWPKLAQIKNRCAIELALDRILLEIRNRQLSK